MVWLNTDHINESAGRDAQGQMRFGGAMCTCGECHAKREGTEPCPNCKETVDECACMRNKCNRCKKPVGNITFSVCDECWVMS